MRLPTLALIVITAAVAAHAPAAEYPKPGIGLLAPVNVNGMTFANSWIPGATGMKSRMQDGLELYSKAVGGNPESSKGRKPGAGLWWSFKWLMSYDDIVKALPSPHDRAPEQQLMSDCLPQNSLTIAGFHIINMLEDHGHKFDWIYFVLDKQRRLVGLELVATSPKDQPLILHKRMPPHLQAGRMEPYYDYINVKSNASTTQEVQYEIEAAEPGVRLIHTALFRGPKCLENVHWYLAAPFAHALLQITEARHREGR